MWYSTPAELCMHDNGGVLAAGVRAQALRWKRNRSEDFMRSGSRSVRVHDCFFGESKAEEGAVVGRDLYIRKCFGLCGASGLNHRCRSRAGKARDDRMLCQICRCSVQALGPGMSNFA